MHDSGILESPLQTEDMTVPDKTKTQSEWFTATNPDGLLAAARPLSKVTSKFDTARHRRSELFECRLRLFGCACARMVWDLLPTDARNAVVISERFAYGQATRADLTAAAVRIAFPPLTFQQHALCAAGQAATAIYSSRHYRDETAVDPAPTDAARSAAKAIATRAAGQASSPRVKDWDGTWNVAYHAARAHQAELIRDIFPPPDHAIRALRLEREWLTSTVMTLAHQADGTGEYSGLPILADALQDAGCDNEFILERCRASLHRAGEPGVSPDTRFHSGLHSRGNWVIDLLLGRE
jgi:hypothetical protein